MSDAAAAGSPAPTPADRHPWSLRVGRLLGIPIDIHVTFLVLLLWIALSPLATGSSLEKGLESAAFTSLVFGIVVLHELGHALVARRYGCPTTRILLLPIGGVASLARMPTRPLEELLVAVAGPAVNVVLASLLAVWVGVTDPAHGFDVSTPDAALATRLLWVNVGLAVFNLLPAFPMDGGRVLRAVLAMFVDRERATQLAVLAGRAIALGLGVLGLLLQPILALVAFFVWSAGRAEAAMESTRAALAGIRVGQVATGELDALGARVPLAEVAQRILAGSPHDVVVVDGDAVTGLLTRGDVLRGLAKGELDVPIGELMHTSVVTAAPDELLESALPRLEASHLGTLVVVDAGRVVGIVDAESLGERILLARALSRRRLPRRAPSTP